MFSASCRSCTKLLVISGSTSIIYTKNYTNRVEVIDLDGKKKTCKLKSRKSDDLPKMLCSIGGGAMKEFPIVCGTKCQNKTFELNSTEPQKCYKWSSEHSWENIAPMAVSRGFFSTLVTDKGLIVMGGISYELIKNLSKKHSKSSTNNIEILAHINENWVERQGLDDLMFFQCSVLINFTTVMLIGGAKYTDAASFGEAVGNTWFYNIHDGKWRPGPSLQYARFGHSCGVIGNKITQKHIVIVSGGMYEINGTRQVISSVEILKFFKPELKWENGPSLPKSIVFGSMIENHKGVYMIGGLTHPNNTTPNLKVSKDIYFLKRNSNWEKSKQKLTIATSNHVAILIPNKIVDCM